jgi:hypothetical protein
MVSCLSDLSYYFWGNLKENKYKNNSCTAKALPSNIMCNFFSFKGQTPENVTELVYVVTLEGRRGAVSTVLTLLSCYSCAAFLQ